MTFKYRYPNSTTISPKKSEKRHVGVLAQNLEENFGFAVSEQKKPEDSLYVNYATINIYLIDALKVLIEKNSNLDGDLENARNRFDSLSAKYSEKLNL